MNKNILIVLGGGFLIAVLVALMVQMSLSGNKKQQVAAVKQEAKVMLVVASKPLKAGDKLDADSMKWQEWPKSGVFPGAVVQEKKDTAVEDAITGRVQRDVSEGEPIISTAVIKDGSTLMAANLREGMRAVSIDVKAASGVAGFVAPGDYVDVMLTYNSRIKYQGDNTYIRNMLEANFSKSATEIIIENVRVLATDQRMRTEEGQKMVVPKTITLEVTPKGAETLAVARRIGEVSLALRRLGDKNVADGYTPATTDARVTGIWDEIYATMEKISNDNAGQGSNIVRVYNGASTNEVAVQP